MFGRGTGMSRRAPLLWTKLSPELSQCLGSSFLSAKRRSDQEDRVKGMLEYSNDHSASGNVTELES